MTAVAERPACRHDRRDLRQQLNSKDIKERKRAFAIIRGCKACQLAMYKLYRKVMGKCETCGSPMRGHPKCARCTILVGPGHEYYAVKYRRKTICSACYSDLRRKRKNRR